MNNLAAIVAIAILILAFIGALIYPIVMCVKSKENTKNWKKVKGKIVDSIERFQYSKNSTSDNWGWWRYPIVVYNVEGKNYEIISRVGYNKASLLFIKKLTVLYNPINPKESKLSNATNVYKIVIFSFLIAIIFMIRFLINDIILQNNIKLYEYGVTCYYNGYMMNEDVIVEAKNEQEAYKIVRKKYEERKLECQFDLKS